jgi:predicted transposase YbfD/YdcC
MKKTLIESFENIEDPRESNISHALIDIILIAILAILCGADGFNEIEDFGKSKEKWLKKYLKLRNGIPSHDTFNNVLSILEPKEFHNCFMEWVSFLQEKISKEIVSIDGKSIRRTKDNKNNKKAVHIVSAWANKNQLVLGQLKVNDKSNEITAIPELLKILDINGCIITIDAMGTQTEIAKAIVDSGAEYILPVKDNQKTLHNELETYFNNEIIPKENKELVDSGVYYKTSEKGHGRIEQRQYYLSKDISCISTPERWENIQGIGMAINTIQTGTKLCHTQKFYIMSNIENVYEFAKSIRSHWGVETSLHWCLDVGFREDESRARKDNVAENLNIIRHMTLNMLKQEKSMRAGIARKRLKCGWDDSYMEKVLKTGFEV